MNKKKGMLVRSIKSTIIKMQNLYNPMESS
jgi:hypothetical protein